MRALIAPLVTATIVAFSGSVVLSQAPTKPKKGEASAAAPAKPATPPGPPLPSPPADFTYSSEGRRDPFLSLVNRGADARGKATDALAKRPEGVGGLDTEQIVVRGILQRQGTYVAMVSGADGKVYTVRVGDRLFDGVIRAVTPQAVVILQEVNDPLSLEKQREVRKFLRGGDEVK